MAASFEELLDDSDEGEQELDAPEKPLEATSTSTGSNKFRLPLYLRVMGNRTLRPVSKKQFAHYNVMLICEYPRYEEEIAAKREHTLYDEFNSLRYIDVDALTEWRVRRCLRSWNFHKVVDGFTKKLIRGGNLLTDESMVVYKTLPPLIRKEISSKIWQAIGDP
jgi:hypothetical protein